MAAKVSCKPHPAINTRLRSTSLVVSVVILASWENRGSQFVVAADAAILLCAPGQRYGFCQPDWDTASLQTQCFLARRAACAFRNEHHRFRACVGKRME